MTTVGKAIRIKGEVIGDEDLVIEGQIEGTISLMKNHLTLEQSSTIKADIDVQNVTIKGSMFGNTKCSSKVEVTADAKIVGDIRAPRIVMEEGAKFRGAVEMDVKLPPGV